MAARHDCETEMDDDGNFTILKSVLDYIETLLSSQDNTSWDEQLFIYVGQS